MSIKRFVDAAYLTIQIFRYLRIEHVIPTVACTAFLGSIKSPCARVNFRYNRNIGDIIDMHKRYLYIQRYL